MLSVKVEAVALENMSVMKELGKVASLTISKLHYCSMDS